MYNQYDGEALYLEIKNRHNNDGGHAGNLVFDLYHHKGTSGQREWLGYNDEEPFVEGQAVTLQMGTNCCRIWYGTNVIENWDDGGSALWVHGITNPLTVYQHGVFPQIEIQNRNQSTNVTARISDISCARLLDFTPLE